MIEKKYSEDAAIAKVEIERDTDEMVVSVHTARPGIIIGRGGARVDQLKEDLEKLTSKKQD